MTSNNFPVLSICIPAYNAEKWILETLNSALPLNRKDIEIIVANNHSTDSTLKIVNDFIEKNRIYVSVIEPEKHLSMANNWNFVVNSARGKYVALVSADDLISSEMCDHAINILDSNNDIDVVTYEHDKLIHSENKIYSQPRRVARILKSITMFNSDLVLNLNPYSINFSFFRINSSKIIQLKNNGKLFTRNLMTTDYDLWIRLALVNTVVKYIPNIKGFYRLHNSNLSNGKNKMLTQTFLVLASHREDLIAKSFFSYKIALARLFFRSLVYSWHNSKGTSRLLKVIPRYLLLNRK